ncbi:FtsX-like permease family protein [Iamia majanohamensis]|uniref:FtsX-like permease family protein n=1 Tax=Iamia majanohamensis TaxID=467976 RepID=A0AAF0BU10_9ACTN|nr:FtsX-like permease family protein [Iamia majanohamensis]WCO67342.1 FtsX-like permease family protein [Iamia majanohamensis]
MLRLSLRTLRAHARRFTSTVVAVALGVAFLAGVLVLVATFQRSFDDMFATGTDGTAAVVRAADGIELDFGDTARGEVDAALATDVAATPGVAAVAPQRDGTAQIEGADGEIIGGGGPPQVGSQWIDVAALNPWELADGRAPEGPDEVVVDAASARDGDLAVGDRTRVFTPEPVDVTVVGVATYGSADSAGPLTQALFSEEGAVAHLGGTPGQVDGFLVAADDGVGEAEVTAALGERLPDGVEAITGQQLTEESQQIGEDFVGLLRPALLAFALIALVVGAFSIYNTFAIVVAQRTRDAALLRAIGASRRQITGATLLEAGIVGLVGAGLGLALGLGLAAGLSAVMAGATGLSTSSLVVSGATVALSLSVGIGVTVVAALLPARRASRVPPVAALRDLAVDGGRVGRVRTAVGLALLVTGGGLGITAAVRHSGATPAGTAAALLMLAAIVLAPSVAGPLVRLLGAPLARVRGVTGVMARRNAVRNPRRTGSTATALIIGVTVVALFTVVGASIRASLDEVIDEQVAGDVVVQGPQVDGFSGLAPSLQERLAGLPETGAAVGVGDVPITLDGEDQLLTYADAPDLDRVIDLGVTEGDLADFGPGQLAVSTGYAEDHDLALGDPVPARHIDGAEEDLTVGLVYDTTTFAGSGFVDVGTVAPHVPEVNPTVMLLRATDGVSAEELDGAAQAATGEWPGTSIETRAEFAETQGRSVDQMLVLVYVLLALSIGIALMGIANTISLSTLERGHEIGLLRAVGQTRRQVRSMVRWEAVMVSSIGTLAGLAVGVSAAWMVLRAAGGDFDTVAVPVPTLVVVALVGAAAGVLASARPAARAARTDVLDAISTG